MIGKMIKKMRLDNGLNQEKVSKLVNIGRTTLSDYEREKTDINFETLENIAKVCNYKIVFINKITKEELQVKDLKRKDL